MIAWSQHSSPLGTLLVAGWSRGSVRGEKATRRRRPLRLSAAAKGAGTLHREDPSRVWPLLVTGLAQGAWRA